MKMQTEMKAHAAQPSRTVTHANINRPVGDSMDAEAYPEAVGDGEAEEGGRMGAPPGPPELLPGLEHFLDDFFSFIQGNSGAIGPAAVAVAGAWPGGQGCWAAR